ncbi:MAG TPA: YidB family protein [Luteimonas sp.]|nr:YidB family protein [Luteimonas sp.]
MFDALVRELSERYGLGDRSLDLFGLLMGYIHNDRRGGFDGFAESFRQQGQGELFASWLGGDPRRQRAANASDIGMVFGQGLLADWGNRIGASRATVAAAIAGILPRLIGELTPGGRLPEAFGATAASGAARRDEGESAVAPPRSEAMSDLAPAAPPTRIPETSLRREDRPRPGSGYDDEIEPIDPHVAAINAAVASSASSSEPAKISDMPLRDFEFRKQQPERGSRWWLWLLILLALGAGAYYYFGQDYLPLDSIQWPGTATPSST